MLRKHQARPSIIAFLLLVTLLLLLQFVVGGHGAGAAGAVASLLLIDSQSFNFFFSFPPSDRLQAAAAQARPGRPGVRGQDLRRGPAVPGRDDGGPLRQLPVPENRRQG